MRSDATGERCVALFLLGLLAFSPPVLSLFRVEVLVLGLPLLYLYLIVAWLVLIGLLAIVVHVGARDGDDGPHTPPSLRG